MKIEEAFVDFLKQCKYFSLQVDETANISDNVFVRNDFPNTFHEELPSNKPLIIGTTADKILNLNDNFINYNNIEWKDCVGFSSN